VANTPYFESQDKRVVLYQGDAIMLLGKMESESFDLIFADPPYFLSTGGMTCKSGRSASVNKGHWDVPKSAEENHAFNIAWLKECQRLLTPNGTIWVSGTMHVIFSIGFAMQQLGYKLLNDVIWFKPNAPPNLSCRYFTHSTERLLWAARSKKSKHLFNDKLMRTFNDGRQMRNLWIGSPERDIDVDLWKITSPKRKEKENGKHPTQKPLELMERILLSSTEKNDRVLDPFQGSGTTGIAALLLGRRFVGIDAEEKYLKLAVRRLEAIKGGSLAGEG